MSDPDFHELAGRIEAIGRSVLHLTAVLEDAGLIDGPRFSDGLRKSFRPGELSPPHLEAATKTLQEMADALDSARSWRQSRAGQR